MNKVLKIILKFSLLFGFTGFYFQAVSQNAIQDLIVETYYISDANDATDIDGGSLPEGSVTYRVYLDLAPGVRIAEIFGNENHPWIVSSTENFWNNSDRGEPYGYDINAGRLDDNTVALDSWITISAASDEHFGILKESDNDGSEVGGENNDGGSEGSEGGLLVNQTPEMGLSLTQADGLVSFSDGFELTSFQEQGLDIIEEILGEETVGDSIVINGATGNVLQADTALSGPTEDNIVLIAQLTTLGEITFKFNVVLEVPDVGDDVVYVASGGNLQPGEVVSPFLSFPPECGCTDPDYLEFDPAAPCDDGSCETLVVLGCANPDACNFNPDANINVPELCCFAADSCNGLDWTIICPTLSMEEKLKEVNISTYPNPTRGELNLRIFSKESQSSRFVIYNLNGKAVRNEELYLWSGEQVYSMDMQGLENGAYLIRIFSENFEQSVLVVKN